MENRINRKDDESLYQPKIHSQRIRTLYNLKQATGKPMTVLLDQAIHELAIRYQTESRFTEDPDMRTVNQETWDDICQYREVLDELDYERCLDELQQIKASYEI